MISNLGGIGIDLDEVLCHTIPHFLKFYNEKYKTNFVIENFHEYAWEQVLAISQEKLTCEIREFYSTNHFLNILPRVGAYEVLLKLKDVYNLSVVTSRWSEIRNQTIDWVDLHFPNIFSDIFFSSNNFVSSDLSSSTTKADLCLKNDLGLLIEDAPAYIEQCITQGVDVIVYAQPWNKRYNGGDVIRVDSWEEIGDYLLA